MTALPPRGARRRSPAPLLGLALVAGCAPPLDLNTPPTITVLSPAFEATVNEGDAVDLTVRVTDADGDLATLTVVDAEGVELARETLASADETIDLPLTGFAPGRQRLTVVVDDGRDRGARDREVIFDVNGRPTPPTFRFVPETPTPADDVEVQQLTPASDPEGGELALNWAFLRRGSPVVTGTGLPTTLSAALTEPGDVLTFRLEVSETVAGTPVAQGITVTVSEDLSILDVQPPTAPAGVTVRPARPHPAQALHCLAEGSTDPDGDPITYLYRWQVDDAGRWVDAAVPEEPTLPIAASSPGSTWRCLARASDGAQESDERTAEVTFRDHHPDLSRASTRILPEDDVGVGRAFAFLDLDLTGPRDVLALGGPDDLVQQGVQLFDPSTWATAEVRLSDRRRRLTLPADDALGRALWPVGDVNGDGLDDVAVLAGDSATLHVVDLSRVDLTGGGALDVGARAVAVSDVDTRLDRAVASAHLDGDRFAEVLVTAVIDGAPDEVQVLDGDAFDFTGLAPLTSRAAGRSVIATSTAGLFGVDLDAGGDFAGDGVPDVIIGSIRPGERIAAYIFGGLGLATGGNRFDTDAVWTIAHNTGADAGQQVGFYPDLDGNGRDEAWLSAPGAFSDKGRVAIFLALEPAGTALDFFDEDQDVVINGEAGGDRFGEVVELVGDLGVDGLPELAVGAPGAALGAGRVYVFDSARLVEAAARSIARMDAESLDAADADWILTGPTNDDRMVPGHPAGDVDGDGLIDLLVTAPNAADGLGAAFLYRTGQ